MKRPLLTPFVPLYGAGVALRTLGFRLGVERVQRLAWPVVSLGNVSAGGTGKTPLTIALAKLLVDEGFAVDVLSRGYGRRNKEAARVELGGSAEEFGDEPLVIGREAGVRVYVGARRWEAGLLAEAEGAGPGVHLLDDGFQHRQLARAVDIVLVNSEDLGDWLLPAGNLREPLGALRRATAFAVAEDDDAAAGRLEAMGKPIWRFRREMVVDGIEGTVVAFCGIARPGQFFAGLERAGVKVAERQAFGDHHRFEGADVALLGEMVRKSGASVLVTTAKDRVRLGRLEEELQGIAEVVTAGLRVSFCDEAGVTRWLRGALGAGAVGKANQGL